MTKGLRPLFQINDDLAHILAVVEDCEGELDKLGECKEAFIRFMDATSMEAEAKVENCAFAVKHLKMLIAATKAELDQFKKRLQSLENAETWIKDNLKTYMILTGMKKLSTPSGHEISLRANGGVVWPKVDDEKFNALTREELNQLESLDILALQPLLDKAELKRHMDEGRTFDWATAGERGQHVQIK